MERNGRELEYAFYFQGIDQALSTRAFGEWASYLRGCKGMVGSREDVWLMEVARLLARSSAQRALSSLDLRHTVTVARKLGGMSFIPSQCSSS